jgi:predicted P-loop ATPase
MAHAGVMAAQVYVESGWPVFPVQGKRPLEDWKAWQTRLPTEAEIDSWDVYGEFGLALACGELVRLVVVDLDLHKCRALGLDPEEVRRQVEQVMGPTGRVASTGGGGEHWFYALREGVPAPRNATGLWGLPVDLRGEGGYVVIPPSPGYRWLRECEAEELPEWRNEWLEGSGAGGEERKAPIDLVASVAEGARNDHLARVAGVWLSRGCTAAETLAFCLGVNQRFQPPLETREVEAVVASVAEIDARNVPEGHTKGWAEEGDFEQVVRHEGDERPLPPFERVVSGMYAGRIKATLENVCLALADGRWFDGHPTLDTFYQEVRWRLHGVEGRAGWRDLTDADLVAMRRVLERRGFSAVSGTLMSDAVLLVGADRSCDSAIEWLDGLTWDGVPRMAQMMTRGFGCEDGPYAQSMGRYLMTAFAGRVSDGGCQADNVVILIGDQGTLKTSAVRALAPWEEAFGEIHLVGKEEDILRQLRGVMVAEFAELIGLRSRDLESIKAFISRRVDTWIPKYRERKVHAARRCLFIGTTNEETFLVDSTGNRRFLPIRTGAVDLEWLRRWRDQLWAEGHATYLVEGVDWAEVNAQAADAQEIHRVDDAWDGALDGYLARHPGGVNIPEILSSADFFGVDLGRTPRGAEMRIARLLRKRGFRKTGRMKNRNMWFSAKSADCENDGFEF